MIFIFLLQALLFFLNSIFFWMPVVDRLPLGIDAALVTAIGYFKGFMAIFPPLQIIWDAVLWYMCLVILIVTLRWFRIIR